MDPIGPNRSVRARARFAADPAVLAGWLAVVAAFLLDPAVSGHLPLPCPFLALTGLPCPGCGLSRAVVWAAHFDLAASFAFHPFGAPLLAATVAALVVRPPGRRLGPWLEAVWRTHRGVRIAACVVAGAWMAWAVARAITAART